MSKGLGQKIGIKFTEDLIGDVSGKDTPIPFSFYRWYITSTWSSSGRLYLYELEFFSNGTKVNTNKIISMAGSSRYSSNYDVDRLFDGSVPGREWDANGSLPHWVSIELDEAIVIDSFRWHTGTSSNKPKEFILQGSNDGINWVDIHRDESPNLNNWIDFVVTGVGNEIAFTVTGKEYQYVNGPLVDKEYQVEKVERYPIQRVWEDEFKGGLINVQITDRGLTLAEKGSMTEKIFRTENDWKTGEPTPPTSLDGINVEFSNDTPDGSIGLKFNATGGGSGYQYISYYLDLSNTDNLIIYTRKDGHTARHLEIYIDNVKVYSEGATHSWTKRTFNVTDIDGIAEIRLGVQPSSGTLDWTAGFALLTYIVANYELEGEYINYINVSGQYRIKWQDKKPNDTNIKIKVATIEDNFNEVRNGDIITTNGELWIKATLSTEDVTVTPILQDLWLEEVSASQDKILITMHPQGRFNNVEGPLTVQYDQSQGSLRGRGGPVESFEVSFTPEDLVQKPNPHVTETITVKPEIELQFLRVEYHDRFEQDTRITAKPSISIEFINVGEINP